MGLSGSLSGAALGGALSGAAVNRYDTGLHRPQRSEIRTALVDRIAAALAFAEGRYLRAVRGLPRQLKNDSPEEMGILFNVLQGQAPAVAVALGRKDYEPSGMGVATFEGTIDLAVYVVSANPRSREDGRLSTDVAGQADPTADPGVETILEHVEELLVGQELNIKSISEVRPRWEDELCTLLDVTIWEQHFTLRVERVMNPERDNDEVLTEIEGDNLLDGADEVNPVVVTVAELEIE